MLKSEHSPMQKKKPPPSRFSLSRLKGKFSFFEYLIALVIVGVTLAIFIPHFTRVEAEDHEEASITLLRTLRAHIEQYKQEHKGTLPNLIQYDWKPLMQKTDSDGNASEATDGFGPYILELPPVNPINKLSNITDGDSLLAASETDCGFIYDYAEGKGTGQLWPTTSDKRSKPRL
jgi:type II secretory pathway pseudopilin PulG